ncbi:MAG: FAD-dependent oxidoreductase, partial [Bacteroidetes bacterium]|nr:FAD-dependent oxidoreductase [Bacteroidota bacterium]
MESHIKALQESKYEPLWLDNKIKPETLPPLEKDVKCELLIVGGGFTGLWAALQAKERLPELDIILIESAFIGYGASGRNGGMFEALLAHGSNNSEYHFPGEQDRLVELGLTNSKEFVASLEKYGIDARYEQVGNLRVATNEGQKRDLREKYEEFVADGENVTWYEQDEVRQKVNSETYIAGMLEDNGVDGLVDPACLAWGLKKTILDLGVKIYEGTPLSDITSMGEKMLAVCDDGTVECDKILMATNAFPNPMSQINKSIIPVWDYALATEPLNTEQLESIKWGDCRHGVVNNANMFHYYRMTKDNRITWGGGGAVMYYYGGRTDQGVADDTKRFENLSKEFFETFPQLEGIKFTHRWSGIIASSTRFCMVPGIAYEGRVAWAVGYTGLGVSATRFGARIGIELLGYQPSDILDMMFVKKKVMNWPPEPLKWIGVTLTRKAMSRADVERDKLENIRKSKKIRTYG